MSHSSIKLKTDQFLQCEHIAVVGVSNTNPREAANINYQKLKEIGYSVYPVNPKYGEFQGEKCYASVIELAGIAEAALIFTPPKITPQVVRECYDSGIKNIWIHRGIGTGSRSVEASDFLKDKPEVNFIDGACPMMFIQNGDWFHRGVKKVLEWTGGLPA